MFAYLRLSLFSPPKIGKRQFPKPSIVSIHALPFCSANLVKINILPPLRKTSCAFLLVFIWSNEEFKLDGNCYKHIQSIGISFKNMGMCIDESYDTEVRQNRCHSQRHRTTFLTRRPGFQLWSHLSQLFICAFYHAPAYSPLLQAVFCITRTTNTTMSFVIVVSKTLQDAVERRIEASPDAFHFSRGYLCQHLKMVSSRSLLFSFATRETSDWRELKNARSSTFRSGLWAG